MVYLTTYTKMSIGNVINYESTAFIRLSTNFPSGTRIILILLYIKRFFVTVKFTNGIFNYEYTVLQ